MRNFFALAVQTEEGKRRKWKEIKAKHQLTSRLLSTPLMEGYAHLYIVGNGPTYIFWTEWEEP